MVQSQVSKMFRNYYKNDSLIKFVLHNILEFDWMKLDSCFC